jgi:hypothetical protein
LGSQDRIASIVEEQQHMRHTILQVGELHINILGRRQGFWQMPVKNGNSDVDLKEFDQYLKDNNCMCTTSASHGHTTLQVGDLKMMD